MRSGLSCGGVLGLVGGSGEVDVYAPASAREAIMQEHALEPGDGPVLVRWVSDPIWARLPEHRSAPFAAVLADLMESDDPRVRREAGKALAAT